MEILTRSTKNIDVPEVTETVLREDFTGAFKKVIADGEHVATMLAADYEDYKDTGRSPEEDAMKLFQDADRIRGEYPQGDIQDAIGWMLTQGLP